MTRRRFAAAGKRSGLTMPQPYPPVPFPTSGGEGAKEGGTSPHTPLPPFDCLKKNEKVGGFPHSHKNAPSTVPEELC